VSSTLTLQVATIARRSIRRTVRQPAVMFPVIVFPLFFLALNAGGLSRAIDIPGFPKVDSFLDFALCGTFMQGSLFAMNAAGSGIAEDIEGGFLNRLSLTPMRGAALVAGQLAGAASIGLISSSFFIVIGLVFGVHIASGVLGALLLIVLATFTSLALATIGAMLALRSGSTEAIQGLFPVMFVFFFMSSLNMPRDLMTVDWFHAFASANPISYLIEGMRSLVIEGWNGTALLRNVAVIAVLLTIGLFGSARALRTRMART
jgi:ABC-2 type transport system permease protein